MTPEIYPPRSLYTTYNFYLSYALYPVVTPFKNISNIDIYNDNLFRPASKVSIRLNDTSSNSI